VSTSTGENLNETVQLSCTGNNPTYSVVSGPSHGSLGTINQVTGQVSYTPNSGYTGMDSFTYRATNASGTSSTMTVSIAVNSPPACEDAYLMMAEGQSATATMSCVDSAGATLNYSIVSAPSHGTLGLLHQSTGEVSYTPNAGYSGTDSFTYEATSANGTSNVSTMHITVNALPACQDASATTGAGNPVDVQLNCSDATGASVTYSIVSEPSHGSLGTINQATGQVAYTPNTGFTGSDSFTYQATSANGTSATATVSLTVNPAPTCQNVSTSTGAAEPVVIALSCSDSAGAPLTYAIDTQPSHGSLGSVAQSSGEVTYTPAPGYTGPDSFSYHAISANGSSAMVTASITVNPPPDCHAVSAGTKENQAVGVQLSCTDSATLTYAVDMEPSHGTLGTINQSMGQVSYTPTSGYSGWDSFTYHASSTDGISTTQTVSIAVRPAVTMSSPANGAQTNNPAPAFLGTASTGESDGTSVTVTIVTGANFSAGTVVQTLTAPVQPSGTWSVSPSTQLADGTYSARSSQSDAAGLTGSATHTFTIDTVAPAVTLASPANGSATNQTKPMFSGAAGTASGDKSTVTLKIYSGTSAAGTPVQTLSAIASGGSWSKTASSALANGTYTAQAQQSDKAGNTGFSSANTFTVDTVKPVVALSKPANCASLTSGTPTFSGTAGTATGDSSAVNVLVYLGAVASGSPVQVLTAPVSGGSWSVQASPALPGATYTAQARQTDDAGNVGLSTANTFNVDTTVVSLTQPSNCSYTNNNTPTFSGGAGTASGDSSTITVNIYAGKSVTATPVQTLTATASGGSWSVAASSALADGPYVATASQALGDGTTSTSPANRFTVDTLAPAVTLAFPANGSSTSSTQPAFTGTAGTAGGDKPTITVRVFAGTVAAGTPVQTLTTTAVGGNWGVASTTALAPGTYTAIATQSDLAGNTGSSSANTFTIT
jgi:hypothetical protein